MDLKPPTCNHPDCVVVLVPRHCTGRRGDRTATYDGHGWRCTHCADPDSGDPPLDFVDAQLMKANAAALAAAWRAKYGEDLPPSGRPGRKTDHPKTERVAVLLTPEELDRVDARRGARSRSEFLRDVITRGLHTRRA
jgi:hypothetical protein